jgi:hypothetical protein
MPLNAVSIWTDWADLRLGDDARSPHRDLVAHGAGLGMPEHRILGDAV